MEIGFLKPVEQKYTCSQNMQINCQTANIGHLRGDFDNSGNGFSTTWFNVDKKLNTDEFKKDLDDVINSLRFGEHGLLKDRHSVVEYASQYPDSIFCGNYCTEYGFRVNTASYAYLFRCNPTKGDYNFYCYCFVKEFLDKHIKRAERGIRFVDSNRNELFQIPDGGKILISYAWGEKEERVCRFVDEYHTEVGGNIYHTYEFADCMERNGHRYKPK